MPRRYLSPSIARDGLFNQITSTCPFAGLFYLMALPHAADDCTLPTNDPEELYYLVCPAQRQHTPADVAAAIALLTTQADARGHLLLEYGPDGALRYPPASFYRHQSFVPLAKRTAPAPALRVPSISNAPVSANFADPSEFRWDQRKTSPHARARGFTPSPTPTLTLTPTDSPSLRSGGADDGAEPAEPAELVASVPDSPKEPVEPSGATQEPAIVLDLPARDRQREEALIAPAQVAATSIQERPEGGGIHAVPKPPGTHPFNDLWAAFDQVFGEARARTEKQRRGAACKEAAEAHYTGADLLTAAGHWGNVMGDATMTEHGIIANLGKLLHGPQVNGRAAGTVLEHKQRVTELAAVTRSEEPSAWRRRRTLASVGATTGQGPPERPLLAASFDPDRSTAEAPHAEAPPHARE